jgi:anti-sigma regulatory factor (Ser/Thr protein kinase)
MAAHTRWHLSGRHDLSHLRHEVRDELEHAGLPPTGVFDLLVVLSELTTNGLQAADGSRAAVTVVLNIDEDDDVVELLIKNVGVEFDADALDHDLSGMPSGASTNGRGLAVAAALSDELEITPLIGGTQVRATRRRIH